MSIVVTELVPCPRCQFLQECAVARSINAGRKPAFRVEILARKFQRTVCGGCHRSFEHAGRFLYVDFPQGHWFGVLPGGVTVDLGAEEERLRDSFRRTVLEAPEVVRELGATARVRMVFGVEDLREKLVLFAAGLDDLAVELVKLELNDAAPEGFALQDGGRVWFEGADASGLRFRWHAADAVRSYDWVVERAAYDAVAAPDAYPKVRAAFAGRLWIDARRALPVRQLE